MKFHLKDIGRDFSRPIRCGRVHSVYKTSINIQFDTLIAVLGPEQPLAAWCGRLDTNASAFNTFLKRNMPCVIQNRQLIIANEFIFDFEHAAVWQTDRLPEPKINYAHLPVVIKILRKLPCKGLCRLLPVLQKQSAPDDPLFDNLFCHALDNLNLAWVNKNLEEMLNSSLQIIGAGPGLTPAGDDLIIGWLAGKFALAGRNNPLLIEFGRKLRIISPGRTSDVSFNYLSYACKGSFSQLFPDLLLAMQAGKEQHIESALANFLAFGASSGGDSLAGFLNALGCQFGMLKYGKSPY